MKNILIILILFISQLALTQPSFYVNNNNLQWQKVYASKTSIDDYNLQLLKTGAETTLNNNYINFYIKFDSKKLTPYGFKPGSYPTYIQLGGNYSGIIEFKEGKLRVTVNNIEVVNALNPDVSFNISEYIIKKGEIKTQNHHQKTLNLLNDYFTATFTVKSSDHW